MSGTVLDGFNDYFTSRFQQLLIEVYKVICICLYRNIYKKRENKRHKRREEIAEEQDKQNNLCCLLSVTQNSTLTLLERNLPMTTH
ncbi:non-specific serine/threonine protein kinase [Trifolium repens]|nr:non-specific serine/threonine protein kinase [Trifolium repens]